jgi:hypothetical protein
MATNGAAMSWAPEKVEAGVLNVLGSFSQKGDIPALVEIFAELDEINRDRFTPGVKRGMVDYLVKRGANISKIADVRAGKHDELFALAYEHATAAASAEADPLDAARTGRNAAAANWDFTVETFDLIEQQGVLAENIKAAGAIDYVYELGERMGIFRLADALVLNWSSGAIDVADGTAAGKLYRYWKVRDDRSSPEERGMLFKRVLNKGRAELLSRMVVNEPFPRLWQNLMAEVAEYIDKTEKIREGRGDTSPVSRSPIYQSIKEVQYNLTEYCTGMAHMQVRELYAQLQEALGILGDPEIIAHFGGNRRKSMWTVIERLSKQELQYAVAIGPTLRLAVDGNRVFQACARFDGSSMAEDEFDAFLQAAESYILNASLVGAEEPGMADEEEMEEAENGASEEDFDDDF